MNIQLTDIQAFAAEAVGDVFTAFFVGLIFGAALVCVGVFVERNRK